MYKGRAFQKWPQNYCTCLSLQSEANFPEIAIGYGSPGKTCLGRFNRATCAKTTNSISADTILNSVQKNPYSYIFVEGSYTFANKGLLIVIFCPCYKKSPSPWGKSSLHAKYTPLPAKNAPSPFFRLASENLHSCCWAALLIFGGFGC